MFKLNIECTKDITELHINFADGTSAVVEKGDKVDKPDLKEPKEKVQKPKEPKEYKSKLKNYISEDTFIDPRENLYDYNDAPDVISKEVVKLPEIPDRNREVKVAQELQNLDF